MKRVIEIIFVVREEVDIDKIGEKVAKEIKKVRLNMVWYEKSYWGYI